MSDTPLGGLVVFVVIVVVGMVLAQLFFGTDPATTYDIGTDLIEIAVFVAVFAIILAVTLAPFR